MPTLEILIVNSKLHGSSGDSENDSKRRLGLLQSRWNNVVDVHQRAVSAGMNDPVIFLVDCEDTYGHQLAKKLCGDVAVDAQIEATQGGKVPDAVVVWIEPLSFATAPNTAKHCPLLRPTLPFLSSPSERG